MSEADIIAVTVSASGAIFALLLWLNARKALKNQIYLKLLEEYSSPEMLAAVQSLNDLRDRSKDESIPLDQLYRKINTKDIEEYKNADARDKSHILRNSINNHRRMVTHFYYRVLSVVKTHVVPDRYVFRYWGSGSLHLILDVIDKLALDKDKRLNDLYLRALRFEKSRRSQIAFFIILGLYVTVSQLVILWFRFGRR
jgi:hypothetical protein